MDPQLQGIEVQAAAGSDDDLSVEHASGRKLPQQVPLDLGKVAVQWLALAALNEDLVAIAEDQRPEAVPLGLEDPTIAPGQLGYSFGQHGEHREAEGKGHAPDRTRTAALRHDQPGRSSVAQLAQPLRLPVKRQALARRQPPQRLGEFAVRQ